MKKFYKSVTLTEETSEGFGLLLDGKPVKTPARKDLVIHSYDIAQKIVQEWDNQKDIIIPSTMPISQMAMTLIDRVIPFREKLEQEMLGYTNTDLICYRTDEPENYKHAQEEKWNPFIDWFHRNFDLELKTTSGLSPITQSDEVHQTIKNIVKDCSHEKFMAAYLATLGTGSIILALAFILKAFPVETILDAAFAEERLKDNIYLSDIYGSAPEQSKKYETLRGELETLQYFIT